jgi:hypothetical protein
MDLDKTYPLLVPERTVFRCWAVFADFDDGPETRSLVWCASEELANQIVEFLDNIERDGLETTGIVGNETWGFCLPTIDGQNWSRVFQTREEFRPLTDICLCLRGALEALRDEDYEPLSDYGPDQDLMPDDSRLD